MKNIFISYSHKDKTIADDFTNYSENILETHRDDRDLRYGKSIKDYMKSIKHFDFALMIISDDYLKSENCMYEVLEFVEDENYKDKILPIIIKNAPIFNTEGQLEYIKYWQNKYNNLKEKVNDINVTHTITAVEKLRIYDNIQSTIGVFLEFIGDFYCVIIDYNSEMKLLTKKDFDAILNYILPGYYEKKEITTMEQMLNPFVDNTKHFPISNIVYTCNLLLNNRQETIISKDYWNLIREINKMSSDEKELRMESIRNNINKLRKTYQIEVEFVPSLTPCNTYFLHQTKRIIIYLSQNILNNMSKEYSNSKYAFARAVGNILINTDHLINIPPLLGSEELDNVYTRTEQVNFFAKRLLEIYSNYK